MFGPKERRILLASMSLGIGAALLLALFEIGALGEARQVYFDNNAEFARFALTLIGFLLGLGLVVGCAEGVLGAALLPLVQRKLVSDRQRAQAVAATVLAMPLVAFGCSHIFAGEKARTIFAHDLIAIVLGIAALIALYVCSRLLLRIFVDASEHRLRTSLVAIGCFFLAWLLYRKDVSMLPRLYPFFHRGLEIAAFAALQISLALLAQLVRLASRRWFPTLAGIAVLLSFASGSRAWRRLQSDRALRTISLELPVLEGALLRVALATRAPPVEGTKVAADARCVFDVAANPPAFKLYDRDIVLVTIDAMRADRLRPEVMPKLSALAAGGVVFSRAYTQVPHTSFSIATLMAGKPVYSLSALGLDAASHETLATLLKRERYKTAAFYPPSVFTIDRERLRALEDAAYGFEYVKYEFADAHARTDQVIAFLEAEKPTRTFLWVHYFDPHEPYELHPGHLPTAKSPTSSERYDGELHYVDAELARLVDYLHRMRPSALLVIAADHGEEFDEHGGHYHGTTLYEEQVHVPLVMTSLNGELPSIQIAEPVGLVDVAPTLLGLAGITPPLRMRGLDHSGWLQAGTRRASSPIYSEIDRKKMVLHESLKLICDLAADACQFFDLSRDPGERRNLIATTKEAPQLRQCLDLYLARQTEYEAHESDDRVRRALERGRQGNRSSENALIELLAAGDLTVRRQAAQLLARLPIDEKLAAHLKTALTDSDSEVRAWLTVALGQVGGVAKGDLVTIAQIACDKPDAELCGRAALATGRVASIARALDVVKEDKDLTVALVEKLGRSHDPRALEPLLVALGEVRTRLEVVQALSELDSPAAAEYLARWLPHEPYIPVRAAMARLLGRLAARDGTHAAEKALRALLAQENEPVVMCELLRTQAAPIAKGMARSVPRPGDLWVGGEAGTLIEFRGPDGEHQVALAGGAAMVHLTQPGRLSLRKGRVDMSYFRPTLDATHSK